MEKQYANIYEGKVVEIISTGNDITEMYHPSMLWVDISSIQPPPIAGMSAEEEADVWRFFYPVAPVKTRDDLVAEINVERDLRLVAANEATVGMADAFISGLLDADEESMFKAYAAYKLALNRISKQPGYPGTVNWPVAP